MTVLHDKALPAPGGVQDNNKIVLEISLLQRESRRSGRSQIGSTSAPKTTWSPTNQQAAIPGPKKAQQGQGLI